MHDDTVLVAIDEALRSPVSCACGKRLEITARDSSVWLECSTFGRPSRLPAALAAFLRELVHNRAFVIGIPTDLEPAPAVVSVPAVARRALPLHA
jgi:hypothetical protein